MGSTAGSKVMEQQSEEWFAARVGKVTASRIGDVMARTKTGYSASRANYMAELIAERLSGQAAESFKSSAMQFGTDTEPQARQAYEFWRNVTVDECGFFPHPKLASGASPDGLVGTDGLVEIKCPNTATHLDTLLGATVDKKYVLQMHWQMVCTDRQWCDFVSYDPRLPEDYRIHIQRVERNAELIEEITAEVTKFLGELDAKEMELRKRFEAPKNYLMAGE
jgi:putative phage-type endonuclease